MSQNLIQLIDGHCHLDFPAFEHDRVSVLERATEQGVGHTVVPGVSANTWNRLIAFQKQFPNTTIGFGLHPYFIEEHVPADVMKLEETLHKHSNAFVGEIGLDKHCAFFSIQEKLLVEQLNIAFQYQRPVVLHHRKSQNELLSHVKEVLGHRPDSGLIHAFSGSLQQAIDWHAQGFYIGVGGVITYDRAKKTRQAVAEAPLSSMILETDSPDMPLAGFQGERNEPANIRRVFDALCTLRTESPEEISQAVYRNTVRLFSITSK